MYKIGQKKNQGGKNGVKGILNGFTLIELLVVVLIIGILAAIAVPQYQTSVLRSRYQQIVLIAETVVKGQQLYHMANGSYSKSFGDLDIQMPAGGTFSGGGEENEWLHYPWGFCYMTNVYIQCQIQGVFYEQHYAGPRYCISRTSDSIANRVCRSETGKTEYTVNSGTQSNYYTY